jgi:hypothetical protein
MKKVRQVARMGHEKCIQNFSSKTEWKKEQGDLDVSKFEDNIKMDIKEKVYVNWIHLAEVKDQ